MNPQSAKEESEVAIMLIGRGNRALGPCYLSFVELCLKEGRLLDTDWGWIEGMQDWELLSDLAPKIRAQTGTKRRATTDQRRILLQKGITPWIGMANREASELISHCPRRNWKMEPCTERQRDFMSSLKIRYDQAWTKGQASEVISKVIGEDSDAPSKEFLQETILNTQEQILNQEI